MPYDPRDFEQNPSKYQHFRTAVVARSVFTHNGENDLCAGEHVGIAYRCTTSNAIFRRNEPVYAITKTDGKYWGDVYANTLENFVL